METIEALNARLVDCYGIDTAGNRPLFKIVWAEDQLERRYVDILDSGVVLLFPEIREVKKYGYLQGVYVLERLVDVPEFQQKELGVKQSYEPVWTYMDDKRNPLPPLWDATKFIVDSLYAALGKQSMAKYVESKGPEEDERRLKAIQEELFGNETEVSDALRYGEGIVVPGNYQKDN
jgi:hypothetical protein